MYKNGFWAVAYNSFKKEKIQMSSNEKLVK